MPNERSDLKRDMVKSYIERCATTSEDLLKWIFASLIVVESGAIFSLASIETLQSNMFGLPGFLLGASLISVFLSGFFIALGYNNSSTELMNKLWVDDIDRFSDFNEIFAEIKSHNKPYLIGFVFLLFSVGGFIAGCVTVAMNAQK